MKMDKLITNNRVTPLQWRKFMKTNQLSMNLQYFAEPTDVPAVPQEQQQQVQNPQTPPPAIDYTKIQQMLDGTLAAKEDTALKAYFKQQGMTEEEMKQAVLGFKQQKAANQPDVGAIQTELTNAQALAKQATLEKEATLEALSLGVDSKTIPYIIKLADFSEAIGTDGKVNKETLKNSINKVLEDVPQLKPLTQENQGFQIGATGGQQQTTNMDALKGAFGLN